MGNGKVGDLILHLEDTSIGYGIVIECDKGNFRYPYYYNAFWPTLNKIQWVTSSVIKFIQPLACE